MTPSSGIEFLVWLLIAAAIIAILAERLKIPYTVSLVFGGLLLGVIIFRCCRHSRLVTNPIG